MPQQALPHVAPGTTGLQVLPFFKGKPAETAYGDLLSALELDMELVSPCFRQRRTGYRYRKFTGWHTAGYISCALSTRSRPAALAPYSARSEAAINSDMVAPSAGKVESPMLMVVDTS